MAGIPIDRLAWNLIYFGGFLVIVGVPVFALAQIVLFIGMPLAGKLTGRPLPELTPGRKYAIAILAGVAAATAMYVATIAASGWRFPPV